MSRPLFLVGAVVALLLAAPGAAAFEITISGLDSLPEVAAGETHAHQFTVNMASTASQNIICAQDAALTVTLAATMTDDALGLGASVEPTSVTFTIPAGAYIGAAGTTWPGSAQSATFNMDIGEDLPATQTSHTYVVTAAYDGAVPASCQGDFDEAGDSADATVPLRPLPAGEGTPTGSPTNGTTDEPEGDGEESPAPAGLFVVLAVALVAALRRR